MKPRTLAPRILDAFCCQGGAGEGYAQAGFEVVGIDIESQPRYPHRFIQGDAMALLKDAEFLAQFDVIHASPPCQGYSPLNALPSTKDAHEHPDLVGPVRDLLNASGLPWVIENVMTAPLDKARSIVLCGEMFRLRTIRHRRFEYGGGLTLTAPDHPKHTQPTATSRRRERWAQGWHVSITGDVGTYVGPEAMGIDWMTGNGLSEAIPPAYTQLIGEQMLAHFAAKRVELCERAGCDNEDDTTWGLCSACQAADHEDHDAALIANYEVVR